MRETSWIINLKYYDELGMWNGWGNPGIHGKHPLEMPRRRLECNLKMNRSKVGYEGRWNLLMIAANGRLGISGAETSNYATLALVAVIN
jgi:hypothetical protein